MKTMETDEQKKQREFSEAMRYLNALDKRGAAWLKLPLTEKERKKKYTSHSAYGSSYHCFEPKASWGVTTCWECKRRVKKHYPHFPAKECTYHGGK